MQESGVQAERIGVEMAFLPVDAGDGAAQRVPGQRDQGRAVRARAAARASRRRRSSKKLRIASELVIDSMLAVIARHGPGATKRELTEALRREETNRGLTFEYCLIAAGTSLNRAPSAQRWEQGRHPVARFRRQLSRLYRRPRRMAILGEPDAELEDMLAEIEAIQRAAIEADQGRRHGRRNLCRGRSLLAQIEAAQPQHFLAHGMGLVSHEAPRLTDAARCPTTTTMRSGRSKPAW